MGRIKDKLVIQTKIINIGETYFRGKNFNGSTSIKDKQFFFHTPFEYKRKVNSTRFSYPGFPALYLSNALIVNYLEVRCTNINEFQAVKYFVKTPVKLLELNYLNPSADLKTLDVDLYENLMQKKAMLYPLYALCFSINDTEDTAPEEYIIPQFLCRWQRDNTSFDGIKYPSTKTNSNNYKRLFYNLILPPKIINSTGFCDYLKSIVFNMSGVCSWSHHSSDIDSHFTNNYVPSLAINIDVDEIEWPSGTPVVYNNTEIGKMEFYMNNFIADPIPF